MPRVAIIQKFVPQYRRRFFDLLREELAGRGIELLLLYGEPTAAERSKGDVVEIPWAVKIPQRILTFRGRNIIWQKALPHLNDVDLVVVEHAGKLLLNYLLLLRQLWGGTPVALWGHGQCFQKSARIWLNEYLKRKLALRPRWWFAYNDLSARVVEEVGFPRERITSIGNAIDTRELVVARRAVTAEQKAVLRAKLGLQSQRVGIYIGAMYREKRLEFLLDACRRIRQIVPDFEMIFVGGGPDAGLVTDAAAQNDWIHYVGPRFDEEKVQYAALANCLLLPSGVGLAILDAFALELPLVTGVDDAHGPEIDYLINGENGLMVEERQNAAAFARVAASVLTDENLRTTIVNGCRQAAEMYTVETMSERFARGICGALAQSALLAPRP